MPARPPLRLRPPPGPSPPPGSSSPPGPSVPLNNWYMASGLLWNLENIGNNAAVHLEEDAEPKDTAGEDSEGEDAAEEDAQGEDAEGEDIVEKDVEGEDAEGEDAEGKMIAAISPTQSLVCLRENVVIWITWICGPTAVIYVMKNAHMTRIP